MRIDKYLLGGVLLLGACSGKAPSTETPVTYSSSAAAPAAACPTTDTLIPVAMATPIVPGQITAISEIHCALPWVVAQVDVRDGSTDEDGEPMSNAYVQIFRESPDGWNAVDRDTACAPGHISAQLKDWACVGS